MSVITSAIAPLAAMIQAINTQLTEQSPILAELTGFKGQMDNLKMDVNDHEQRLTHLNSELHKQDALLTGYKTTKDRIVTSLCMDVNSFTPMGSDMSPVFFELRDRLITFSLFVR